MRDLNKLAKKIHKQNVARGWWKDNRSIEDSIELAHSEISEAMEGLRRNLMDDKLPNRKMAEVEYADTLARTLDFGARFGYVYDSNLAILPFQGGDTFGKKHLTIRSHLNNLWKSYDTGSSFYYTLLINSIIACSQSFGFDIFSALDEKLEFNKTRPDHDLKNREKENGKEF